MEMKSAEAAKWKAAVDEELHSLQKTKTWEVVDRPKNREVIH